MKIKLAAAIWWLSCGWASAFQLTDPTPASDPWQRLLSRLDRSGQRLIEIAELPQAIRQPAARWDANGDGKLDRGELAIAARQRGGQPGGRGSQANNARLTEPAADQPADRTDQSAALDRLRQMFELFDRDGDGRVALQDLPEPLRERLRRLDTDKDGVIDRSEASAAMSFIERGLGSGTQTQRPDRPGPEDRAAADRLRALFQRLDGDGDGRVAVMELPEALRPRFERWDTNGDGYIDRTELRALLTSSLTPRGTEQGDRAAEEKQSPSSTDRRDRMDAPRDRRLDGHQGPQRPKRPASEA